MLGMDASIMMASTPPTGKSGISGLLSGMLHGKPICTKVDYEFTCPACKIRQLEDISVTCHHRMHLRSQVQSIKSLEIARAACEDDPESFAREHAGVAVYDGYAFIDPSCVKKLRESAFYTPKTPPTEVYVSIDPNRGSKKYVGNRNSDYAFVTAYYDEGRLVVIFFWFFFSFYSFNCRLDLHRGHRRSSSHCLPTLVNEHFG